MPTAELAEVARDSFNRTLAAMGLPPDLFSGSGTAQREAARRAHLNLIMPLTRLVESELADKLGGDISLRHDHYFLDMVSRAQVIEKLVGAGVSMVVALGPSEAC